MKTKMFLCLLIPAPGAQMLKYCGIWRGVETGHAKHSTLSPTSAGSPSSAVGIQRIAKAEA